jgi:spore germination protein KB
MEKIKISLGQAHMLAIASITVTGHLLFIPAVISHAGRDTWISALVAFIPALFIGYVISSLAQRYKGQSLVEYSQVILGKWLGKIVAVLLLLYLFHDISLVVRGFGEFFTSAITPRTPIMVFFSAIIILAVYAVRGGLEVIARTNQIFLVILIPLGIAASLLTLKDKDYGNLLPVLEFGLLPALKGGLVLVSLYSTFLVFSMIFPFVNDNKPALKKYSLWTMAILIVMFLGPLTGPIAMVGPERAQGLFFPTFQILRDIQIGSLQRLDLLGIMLWSMGSFSKVSLFLYAISVGIAQLFGLKEYRSLAAPIGCLCAIVALLLSEDLMEVFRFFKDVYPLYSTFFGIGIPTFLLCIAKLREVLSKKSKKRPST